MAIPPRWTIGRVAVDLAILLVAVPIALDWLSPRPRGLCQTDESSVVALGLLILGTRPAWLALKWLNDAGERWLNLPNSPIPRRKPQPLDDF